MPALIEEPLHLEVPPALAELLATVPELSQAYVVGGGVRDAVLGLLPKDLDIEVFGTDYERLGLALARWGPTDLVGRAFGVIKLTLADGEVIDFSMPRRDSKVGAGHRGFAVEADPTLGPREAASRRDYTLNALMYDPRRGVVSDYFSGLADLRAGVLRHIGPAFIEDPLRTLRGMQFASRFELVAAPETVAFCRSILGSYGELPVERVREEWFKWASRSRKPSLGLRFLRETGWLVHFPELAALIGVEQDPEWHPEGDVWEHTLYCADALVELPEWIAAAEVERTVWTLAILLHDVGKPSCTQTVSRDGRPRIISPEHDTAGGPIAKAFLNRIGAPHAISQRVVPLVVEHMAHLQATSSQAVRRLAVRVRPESVKSLAVVITADHFGRPPLPRHVPPQLVGMLERAEQLAVAAVAPARILTGWHLIEAGLEQGSELGEIIRAAYEAQLDGAFEDLPGALTWLRNDARWRERMAQAVPRAFMRPRAPEDGALGHSPADSTSWMEFSEIRNVMLGACARMEQAMREDVSLAASVVAQGALAEGSSEEPSDWDRTMPCVRESIRSDLWPPAKLDDDALTSLQHDAVSLWEYSQTSPQARKETERFVVLLEALYWIQRP